MSTAPSPTAPSTIRRIAAAVVAALLTSTLHAGAAHAGAESREGAADSDRGRGGFAAEAARQPDEVVLGALSPEREPGPRNDMAAPGCASQSSRDGGSRDDQRQAAGCSGLAQSGGPHQGADSFKGGPGCAIQCITSGVAYARGAGARLVTKTDTPARFTLIVWNAEESYYAVRQSDLPRTTSWGATFLDLEADTTYQAIVSAEDADGHVSQASGEFTTLRRFAHVDFGGFALDSYAAEYMAFDFYFSVDWTWQAQLQETKHGQPSLPATLPGGRSVAVDDAPQWLQLAVQVRQKVPTDICEGMVFPQDFPFVSGTWSCWTWDTAFNTVNLDDRPADADSWTEWTLQRNLQTAGFEPGDSFYSPLDFTAPVTVKVWFEPAD